MNPGKLDEYMKKFGLANEIIDSKFISYNKTNIVIYNYEALADPRTVVRAKDLFFLYKYTSKQLQVPYLH